MTPELWSAIGAFSLYTLIGFGLLTLAVFAFRKMWYWFAAIGVCFGGVIGAEIVSFIVLHKSISTQYGAWLNQEPVWGSLGLIFFSLAMISLVLHLVAYAFKRKKK
jgi:hypothetical protein